MQRLYKSSRPYVKHVQTELVRLVKDYQPKGVSFAGICSNDTKKYVDDSPEKMKIEAEQQDYTFPYLFDEMQEVAKAYKAACTPDFFIFDSSLKCVYRGQLDGSRPGNSVPLTGTDVRNALNNIIDGQPVDPDQKPSMGCNIKWF